MSSRHNVSHYNPRLQRTTLAAAESAKSSSSSAASVTITPAAVAEADAPLPEDQDWLALASLLLGVAGLMMKYKICAWLSVFACLSSMFTQRSRDYDIKQTLCTISFSTMCLIMCYFSTPMRNAGPSTATNGGGGFLSMFGFGS